MKSVFKILCIAIIAFEAAANDQNAINHILDSLHTHAADADGDAYFALYADSAIFIGTDVEETWTLEEFKHYALPYFNKGKGWTYESVERQISFSKSGNTAWFVEILNSESYGVTRGTGVLQKYERGWLIEQYHLTMPIPNALIEQVAENIKSAGY